MMTRWLMVVAVLGLCANWNKAAEKPQEQWKVGEPIVTYYAGPAMSEAVAAQMAEGGFNVVWCGEKDLDLLQKHGLRGMLHDKLLSPATLEDAAERAKLDALIERVRKHPAMYSYYIIDEPSAATFGQLGKLVAYLKQRDPSSLAYINLFPTYASNEQLGTKGDVVTAYREHLRQFIDTVKPMLLSYDHYQFNVNGDSDQYFLNLDMIRRASQDAGVPFLNIVQAASWAPNVRVPTPDETRYLVYTTLGYGAQGISYYVYCWPGHSGGIATAEGAPTPIYAALKTLNREFVAIARELATHRSLAIYHTKMKEPGTEHVPASAAFKVTESSANDRGIMLGCFESDYILIVNLNYRAETSAIIAGPGPLELFDATNGTWSKQQGAETTLKLLPGGGTLARVKP